MTPEQATEIREHLVKELNANGFNNILTEVNARLEENYEEGKFESSPRDLLIFFLTESIDILDGLSNKNYDGLINRFNEFIKGDNKIETISVELLNQDELTYYDLKDLPDYKEIVFTFQTILNEIQKEN
jgi:hypothetical protein